MKDGQRAPVEGRFALLAADAVGFALGDYDRSRELIIDPTLEYSTYLGGGGNDGPMLSRWIAEEMHTSPDTRFRRTFLLVQGQILCELI